MAMDVMKLYEFVKWWGRHVWIEDRKITDQFTDSYLEKEMKDGWVPCRVWKVFQAEHSAGC